MVFPHTQKITLSYFSCHGDQNVPQRQLQIGEVCFKNFKPSKISKHGGGSVPTCACSLFSWWEIGNSELSGRYNLKKSTLSNFYQAKLLILNM